MNRKGRELLSIERGKGRQGFLGSKLAALHFLEDLQFGLLAGGVAFGLGDVAVRVVYVSGLAGRVVCARKVHRRCSSCAYRRTTRRHECACYRVCKAASLVGGGLALIP